VNFDLGGEGFAFHDTDGSRTGDSYRANNGDPNSADFDIENGRSIGYTAKGEWLCYTVEVMTEGQYLLTFTTAGLYDGVCRIEVDGKDLFGDIAVDNTGGWSNFQWQPLQTSLPMTLTKGMHRLKFIIVQDGYNLREMQFTYVK